MLLKRPLTHCGHCHTCGTPLKKVLDGEEWCPTCQVYHRYQSHGWSAGYRETEPCPDLQLIQQTEFFPQVYPHGSLGGYPEVIKPGNLAYGKWVGEYHFLVHLTRNGALLYRTYNPFRVKVVEWSNEK